VENRPAGSQQVEPDQSYNVGYNVGYNAGYNAGFDTGFNRGYDSGFEAGYSHGVAKARNSFTPEAGFNAGYNLGYDNGFDVGFAQGYRRGASQTGLAAAEELLAMLLPENHILPFHSANDLLQLALEQVKAQLLPLLPPQEVGARIRRALQQGQGFSVVRLGDGEALVLAQEVVLKPEEIQKRAPWLPYAGVKIPDLRARDLLWKVIPRTDVVGVPVSRAENHQPLIFRALQRLGLDYRRLVLTDALINYRLHQEGLFKAIVANRSVLLVGNTAPQLQPILREAGVHVVGAVAPVRGIGDIDRVMGEIRRQRFDLALISAGVAAVPLVQWVADELGKVALDFGALADELVHGQKRW